MFHCCAITAASGAEGSVRRRETIWLSPNIDPLRRQPLQKNSFL